jgi:hypothetical protein
VVSKSSRADSLGLSASRRLRLADPEVLMRSDLTFGALTHVPNRYLLTMLTSKATRKLHKPGVRIEDTTNDALLRFSRANPMAPELALREPLEAVLRPAMKRPAFPGQSEVVVLPPARENSNPMRDAVRVAGA